LHHPARHRSGRAAGHAYHPAIHAKLYYQEITARLPTATTRRDILANSFP
jgi:hypothetical protein